MNIAVIPNIKADNEIKNTTALCKALASFASVYAEDKYSGLFPYAKFVPEDEMFSFCDIVVTLGGDGTLLAAAGKAAANDKPILGINMGRLGFLTGCEKEDFFRCGYKALQKGFEIEKRMMIDAEVEHLDGTRDFFTVLNDITVTRTRFARLGRMNIHIDGQFLSNYLSDGVVVSTPTGSTGYSLSAGGPIVDPDLEAMLITPICPHMLHARPIAVPPHKTITITKTNDDDNDSAVTADGKSGCPLRSGEIVTIKKSKLLTQLIKINDRSFYTLLRQKLQ